MVVRVTVELPEDLAQRARELAARNGRALETTLVDLIDRGVGEPVVDSLPDDQILALCDGQMDAQQQSELSELLADNREGTLSPDQRDRLEELMRTYRRGLIRKAQAWKTAVTRGLRVQPR